MTQTEALKLALDRIGNYIEKRKSARGIDIESIHAFDLSVDGGFELRLSDLELIKEALAQTEQEHVACNKEMKAQAKQAYPHDEKRELAFIDGWLSREAAHHQNPATTDWGAVHDKLMDVWHHELSADEGLDEIQGLINTTSPQPKEPEQEPVAWLIEVNGVLIATTGKDYAKGFINAKPLYAITPQLPEAPL